MDIKALIEHAGGPAKVAALFGITSQAVSQWSRVPRDRCIPFAHATGIPLDVVMNARPDIFGPAPSKEGEAA